MPVILEQFRERIEKYITGIVNNNGCKMYAIYANPEHIHFLVSRSPQLDEESLATIVANSSEKFINDNHLCVGIFQWQQSCSAFSVSKRHIHELCEYIANQKEHHKNIVMKKNTTIMFNFINKLFTKRTKKMMKNEVMRLYVCVIALATEVVLFGKLGENKVCLSMIN
jgi:REP element-mobilizing transposase RayT